MLIGRGKWRTTRCDFHGGSDSMRVNSESGAWVCMACGSKGGDVVSHHMQRTGLAFPDAARALGAWDDAKTRREDRPRTLSARDAMHVVALFVLL